MGRIPPRDARTTLTELIRFGQLEEALDVLGRAVCSVREYADWLELRPALEAIPEAVRLADARWAALQARVLVGCRDIPGVLGFTDAALARHTLPETAPLLLERAWALAQRGAYHDAILALERAIPHLVGERLGVAFQRLGLANFSAHQPWEADFARARELLESRLLGLSLLDEGHCWYMSGEVARALSTLVEALEPLEGDPYHLAWARYNLGAACLRECDPDAERHFLEAERLVRGRRHASLRATVLCGLGSAHRVRGEWAQATDAYQRALRLAVEPRDRREALVDLGHTHRLRGRPGEALEALYRAQAALPAEADGILVEIAAAHLADGRPGEARRALEQARQPRSPDAELAAILRAELARRDGDPVRALAELEGLAVTSRLAREEARAWPELFALRTEVGLPVPEPLELVPFTEVRVRALGPLRVTVNGRPAPIPPTGRVAELLALLLELGGEATTERLVDDLWPAANPHDKRKALEQLVRELREALGWEGSVRALRRAYALDPDAHWTYDAAETGAGARGAGRFLDGVYSDWVIEKARRLERLRNRTEPNNGA